VCFLLPKLDTALLLEVTGIASAADGQEATAGPLRAALGSPPWQEEEEALQSLLSNCFRGALLCLSCLSALWLTDSPNAAVGFPQERVRPPVDSMHSSFPQCFLGS
jgi:hypothetical protein